MPTCRDMTPEVWEHARRALVFYFERRQTAGNAEDLAQETLMALWRREDYDFAQTEDFLRVCHAFAARVLKHYYRTALPAAAAVAGDPRESARPQPVNAMEAAEWNVLLDEVLRIGKMGLRASDWQLIMEATEVNPSEMHGVDGESLANRIRVRLSRARKRLAAVTGWRNSATSK